MLNDRQSLVDEIERLEKELDAQHFRALFDRKSEHKKVKHLKKLRKELAEQDGTAVTLQPVRRAEPKPAPKPKVPKTPPAPSKPAMARVNAKEPKAPVQPAKATVAKPVVARKPVAKPAAARKPAVKTTRTAPKKPAGPVSKARKKSR